jgi:hypothetical protein
MPDISTTLDSYVDRALDDMMDEIAKNGLIYLKQTIDGAEFSKSPYLKDYKVEAHVANREVTFQIILEEDAVSIDEDTEAAIKKQLAKQKKSAFRKPRIFALKEGRIQRIMRDVRKTADDRKADVVRVQNPKSVTIDLEGRIRVKFVRSITQLPDGRFRYPKDVATEGIFEKFMKDMEFVIQSAFIPRFTEAMEKLVG